MRETAAHSASAGSADRISTPGPTAVLSLRGLTRSFDTAAGPVHAVRGVDLEVRAGEVVALLGPNGAGKTTTLDLVLGLSEPSAGSVEVLGLPPRHAVAQGQVAAVLQTGGLLRDLTVQETVRLIASTYRQPRSRSQARREATTTAPDHDVVEDVMSRAGILDLADRRVMACSGGEQQRLRFALALLPDPDLLVLDEPTAGMDVTARRDFWAAMHAEAARGRTIVFATHYLQEADDFADRIVVMAAGRVVADGTTAQIRATTHDRTLRATTDGSRAELLSELRARAGVTSVEQDGDRLTIRAQAQVSDALAVALVSELQLTDLEVLGGSLDDAFVALTDASDPTHPADPADPIAQENR